jgi:GNAT superfamily N-acetyltransferase
MAHIQATLVEPDSTLSFRTRYRAEANGQIVHDSIHSRTGWTASFQLWLDGSPVGFGSIAIAGPWKDKPTVFEFFIVPESRHKSFELFEAFLIASQAKYFEVQTSDSLLNVMLFRYGCDFDTEKIVFADRLPTCLPSNGAVVQCCTPPDEIHDAMNAQRGGGEWQVLFDGQVIGKGGVLFHYNRPYGDIYMEIDAAHRRKGFGAYFVQEMKNATYELGGIPCARCDPINIASQRTLQKAGLVPYSHILNAKVKST